MKKSFSNMNDREFEDFISKSHEDLETARTAHAEDRYMAVLNLEVELAAEKSKSLKLAQLLASEIDRNTVLKRKVEAYFAAHEA
tara:strand:+ start:47 stop:298 length:252 start_codon:yes stop_codon:yes gene_type:complete